MRISWQESDTWVVERFLKGSAGHTTCQLRSARIIKHR